MTKLTRLASILAMITSPWWVGYILLSMIKRPEPEDWSGLGIIFAIIVGVPLIAITGLISSFIFRHKPNAARLTLTSYLIPTLLVVSWEIATLYN